MTSELEVHIPVRREEGYLDESREVVRERTELGGGGVRERGVAESGDEKK